jgi:hypothetical protein
MRAWYDEIMRTTRSIILFAAMGSATMACSNGTSKQSGFSNDASTSSSIDATATTPTDSGTFFSPDTGVGVDATSACDPPDMLVVLDRTDSMSDAPNGALPANTDAGRNKTKWVLATEAVTAFTAAPTDTTIRFGLELLPLEPAADKDAGGSGQCLSLSAILNGGASNNTSCQPGDVVVAPDLNTGAAIATILDPYTLHLCVSTPLAAALKTATTELASIQVNGRKQFIVLVTDGGESCNGDVVGAAQSLATAGVMTFVIGFGGSDAGAAGVNRPLLNNIACAGQTASGFATACVQSGSGYTAVDQNGPPLYFAAEDADSINTALTTVAAKVCCGCVH